MKKSFLNGIWENPDWRPDLYARWFDKVTETGFLKNSGFCQTKQIRINQMEAGRKGAYRLPYKRMVLEWLYQ